MQRSNTRRYAGTLAALLTFSGALLSGCAGDSAEPAPLDDAQSQTSGPADPSTSGDPSDAADATESPVAEESPGGGESPSGPPTLPPEARGTTRASAGPFVRYWVDTFNYATQQLEPSPLARLSRASCQACSEIDGIIRRIERRDGFMRGASWDLRRTQLLPPGRPGSPQVRAYITFAPSAVLEREGEKVKHYEGGDRTVYTFDLVKGRRTWLVSGIVGVTA